MAELAKAAKASGGSRESDSLLREESTADGALEAGGSVDIFDPRKAGYLCQYFAVGMIYGGLPATMYGVFICYLNVPAYVSSTASTLATSSTSQGMTSSDKTVSASGLTRRSKASPW